ncbi:unnamed protein product [Chrysoparadoxa australica]
MERKGRGKTRLQCHGYRLLLPNMKGHKPDRTVPWVRSCMRAILRSKLWDDAVLRHQQDLCLRFPEFAYSFFEPSAEAMSAADHTGKSRLIAEADENRWALYYGVKALARESAEAKLFWSLLDETQGEDFLTFTLYLLAVIEGIAGNQLCDQWGSSASCSRLDRLGTKITNAAAGTEEDLAKFSGKEVVWLMASDALEGVEHILSKAFGDQRQKVLQAIQAVKVSCDGRLPSEDPSACCLDLFLYVRIMLHSYKEEQVNRRAAVRLMFETAATGILTDSTPIYGEGHVDQGTLAAAEMMYNSLTAPETKPVVDLPQFLAIVRTLNPNLAVPAAITLFRDAHEESDGAVDYETFLRQADRSQFFSHSLQLPIHMPARADAGGPFNVQVKRQLGSLVHRHYHMMKPAIEQLKASLPASATATLCKLEQAVVTSLVGGAKRKQESGDDDSACTPTIDIDGTLPLAAYRRLLAVMYQVRTLRHESGPGYVQSAVRTDEGCVVAYTEREFACLEKVFFDLQVDERFEMFQRIRLKLCVIRVQKAWRRKLFRECVVPLSMLALFRPGYLRSKGRGGVAKRAVHCTPSDAQELVGEIYSGLLTNGYLKLQAGVQPSWPDSTSPMPRKALARAVYLHHIKLLGCPNLTECAIHDLFFGIRTMSLSLPRLRLFAAFAGAAVLETNGRVLVEDWDLCDNRALSFYMGAVLKLRQGSPESGGLFPVTEVEEKTKRERWYITEEEAIAFTRESFQEASHIKGQNPRISQIDIPEIQLSFSRLLNGINMLSGRTSSGDIDADDFLWLVMQHWLQVKAHRVDVVHKSIEAFDGQELLGTLDRFAESEEQVLRAVPSAVVHCQDATPGKDAPKGPHPDDKKLLESMQAEGFVDARVAMQGGEGHGMQANEAVAAVLTGSERLMWDLSAPRTTMPEPPGADVRAIRGELVKISQRYSKPLIASVEAMMEEIGDDGEEAEASEESSEASEEVWRTADKLEAFQAKQQRLEDKVDAAEKAKERKAAMSEGMRAEWHERLVGLKDSLVDWSRVMSGMKQAHDQGATEESSNPVSRRMSQRRELLKIGRTMRAYISQVTEAHNKVMPKDSGPAIRDAWKAGRRTSMRRASFTL